MASLLDIPFGDELPPPPPPRPPRPVGAATAAPRAAVAVRMEGVAPAPPAAAPAVRGLPRLPDVGERKSLSGNQVDWRLVDKTLFHSLLRKFPVEEQTKLTSLIEKSQAASAASAKEDPTTVLYLGDILSAPVGKDMRDVYAYVKYSALIQRDLVPAGMRSYNKVIQGMICESSRVQNERTIINRLLTAYGYKFANPTTERNFIYVKKEVPGVMDEQGGDERANYDGAGGVILGGGDADEIGDDGEVMFHDKRITKRDIDAAMGLSQKDVDAWNPRHDYQNVPIFIPGEGGDHLPGPLPEWTADDEKHYPWWWNEEWHSFFQRETSFAAKIRDFVHDLASRAMRLLRDSNGVYAAKIKWIRRDRLLKTFAVRLTLIEVWSFLHARNKRRAHAIERRHAIRVKREQGTEAKTDPLPRGHPGLVVQDVQVVNEEDVSIVVAEFQKMLESVDFEDEARREQQRMMLSKKTAAEKKAQKDTLSGARDAEDATVDDVMREDDEDDEQGAAADVYEDEDQISLDDEGEEAEVSDVERKEDLDFIAEEGDVTEYESDEEEHTPRGRPPGAKRVAPAEMVSKMVDRFGTFASDHPDPVLERFTRDQVSKFVAPKQKKKDSRELVSDEVLLRVAEEAVRIHAKSMYDILRENDEDLKEAMTVAGETKCPERFDIVELGPEKRPDQFRVVRPSILPMSEAQYAQYTTYVEGTHWPEQHEAIIQAAFQKWIDTELDKLQKKRDDPTTPAQALPRINDEIKGFTDPTKRTRLFEHWTDESPDARAVVTTTVRKLPVGAAAAALNPDASGRPRDIDPASLKKPYATKKSVYLAKNKPFQAVYDHFTEMMAAWHRDFVGSPSVFIEPYEQPELKKIYQQLDVFDLEILEKCFATERDAHSIMVRSWGAFIDANARSDALRGVTKETSFQDVTSVVRRMFYDWLYNKRCTAEVAAQLRQAGTYVPCNNLDRLTYREEAKKLMDFAALTREQRKELYTKMLKAKRATAAEAGRRTKEANQKKRSALKPAADESSSSSSSSDDDTVSDGGTQRVKQRVKQSPAKRPRKPPKGPQKRVVDEGVPEVLSSPTKKPKPPPKTAAVLDLPAGAVPPVAAHQVETKKQKAVAPPGDAAKKKKHDEGKEQKHAPPPAAPTAILQADPFVPDLKTEDDRAAWEIFKALFPSGVSDYGKRTLGELKSKWTNSASYFFVNGTMQPSEAESLAEFVRFAAEFGAKKRERMNYGPGAMDPINAGAIVKSFETGARQDTGLQTLYGILKKGGASASAAAPPLPKKAASAPPPPVAPRAAAATVADVGDEPPPLEKPPPPRLYVPRPASDTMSTPFSLFATSAPPPPPVVVASRPPSRDVVGSSGGGEVVEIEADVGTARQDVESLTKRVFDELFPLNRFGSDQVRRDVYTKLRTVITDSIGNVDDKKMVHVATAVWAANDYIDWPMEEADVDSIIDQFSRELRTP